MKRRKTKVLKTDIVNLGLPGTPVKPTKYNSKDWIPFTGDKGEANQFPNEINEILQQSPTLRAVVASKRDYTVGDALIVDGFDVDEVVNSDNESFVDVYAEAAYFIHAHNSAWLQLVKKGNDIGLFVINPAKVRYMTEGGVGIDKDWKNPRKDEIQNVALYPEWSEVDGSLVSMVHIKQKDSDVLPYSIPDWLGAQFYAKCEYLSGTFNYDYLENGMFPSGVLDLVGEVGSEEEDEDTAKDYKDFLMGTESGNAGKVLIRTLDSIDNKTSNFTPLTDIKDGHFSNLSDLCTQKIITACRWFSSLAGIQSAGSLGSNQQILNEYRIALKTLSRPRKVLENALNNSYFRELGKVAEFEHENIPIVNDEVWQGSQVSSCLAVLDQMQLGTITRDQAVNLMVSAFNLTETEADKIVGA